jgi:hypothetical protein
LREIPRLALTASNGLYQPFRSIPQDLKIFGPFGPS